MFRISTNCWLRRAATAAPSGCRPNIPTTLTGYQSKATVYRNVVGLWPEPLSQQPLDKFLADINYFENPKKFIDIGLALDNKNGEAISSKTLNTNNLNSIKNVDEANDSKNVEEILNILGQEAEIPPLDYDDARVDNQQLIELAVTAGIFRDLFSTYEPDRNFIQFTKEQANNLDKLVPYHWITDQPHARVNRHPKETEPLKYFNPFVGVSARFIQSSDKGDLTAHSSFYGNIVPACEANSKPSITLDGRLLSDINKDNFVKESDFINWFPGEVSAVNFGSCTNRYYSIALLNLDYIHENISNLHWLISDIKPSQNNQSHEYQELCDYLPVHGIKGFGYSRYVFLIFQHDSPLGPRESKISGYSLENRKFDVKAFMHKHKEVNMLPVGLSWFQTTWDISSNKIFHDYLNTKVPVYEHVQAKLEKKPEKAYPTRVPFNIYMDYYRDKKELNEHVLLERLSTIEPDSYRDQYVPPKVPPTVFKDDENTPSWMTTINMKKKNKVGIWRGLRPASATLPLDNNADLDYPIRPIEPASKNLPEYHNEYGTGKARYRPHITLHYNEPAADQQNVMMQHPSESLLETGKKIMQDFVPKQKKN